MKVDLDGMYAVVALGDKEKATFCKLTAKGNSLIATVQNENAGTAPDQVDIQQGQILSLHPNPYAKAGTCYGKKIQPWTAARKQPGWGILNFWREMTEYEESVLITSMSKVKLRLLDKHGLTALVLPTSIWIKPAAGRMAGSYSFRPDGDVISLMPKEWELEDTIHLLAHECGHKLWSFLRHTVQEKWIRYYVEGCKLQDLTKKQLQDCRADWVASGMYVKDYASNLEGIHLDVFNAAIGWITDKYSLKRQFIDVLVASGDKFESMWPTNPDVLSSVEGLVTDYSGKNPEELWCECVGFYAAKKELPEKAKKLLLKSLATLGERK